MKRISNLDVYFVFRKFVRPFENSFWNGFIFDHEFQNFVWTNIVKTIK